VFIHCINFLPVFLFHFPSKMVPKPVLIFFCLKTKMKKVQIESKLGKQLRKTFQQKVKNCV